MYDSLIGALSYTATQNTATTTPANAGLYFMIAVLALIFAVIGTIGLWKIFAKAGRPSWVAVVPIYNFWTFFEISGKPGWWALSLLVIWIPFVGWIPLIVLYILATLELAKRFGKNENFAIVWLIIFSVIGLLALGIGNDQYKLTKLTKLSATPKTNYNRI